MKEKPEQLSTNTESIRIPCSESALVDPTPGPGAAGNRTKTRETQCSQAVWARPLLMTSIVKDPPNAPGPDPAGPETSAICWEA